MISIAIVVAKDCDPEEIVRAVRTVAKGRLYVTAGIAEQLAASRGGQGDMPPHERLSEPEFQDFPRLAKGETIGHMAQGLSTCRTRMMEKMGFESNSDLTHCALKNGLIQ